MSDSVKYCGTGRRKNAVARVCLVPGTGKVTILRGGESGKKVNGEYVKKDKTSEGLVYFGRQALVDYATAPLRLTETASSFDVIARLDGGGISGQAGALRHGISRALLDAGNYRDELKKAGFLTRDSRMVERKKYGLKKARKRPQFSKR